MATKTKLLAILICFLLSSAVSGHKRRHHHCSCRPYKGAKRRHYDNATSAIVGSPTWGNKTAMAQPCNYCDLMVFDDPITLDNNFHSPAVGRAQGMYLYDDKSIYGALLGFPFLFNLTERMGTLNFAGADPLMNKTRDISVLGRTGDFFMARGVATLTEDAFEGEVYCRLRIDIKLYECW